MGNCSSKDKKDKSYDLLKNFRMENMLFMTNYGIMIRAYDSRDFSPCAIDKKRKAYLASIHASSHAINELNILTLLQNPYILRLRYALQDPDNIYLILDPINARLSYYLKKQKKFTENETKYIIASLIIALEYLKSKNIIHRNLNPSIIYFNQIGQIKLYGFEYSKLTDHQHDNPITTTTTATTTTSNANVNNPRNTFDLQAYVAPEILEKSSYSYSSDLFSLGMILYEIMALKLPNTYHRENRNLIVDPIVMDHTQIPEGWSANSITFANMLLIKDPKKRLGHSNIEDLKKHPWFGSSFDWDKHKIGANNPIFKPHEADIEKEASNPGLENKYVVAKKDDKQVLGHLFIGYMYGIPIKKNGKVVDDMV